MKKEKKHDYLAHIYKPLHEFLKKNFKSVNEGLNRCVFEIYKKEPEIRSKNIEDQKNKLFEYERELKEIIDARNYKVISDLEGQISYLKQVMILEKRKMLLLSFEEIFSDKRMEHIFGTIRSEKGYQGNIVLLKNALKTLWEMDIEELESKEWNELQGILTNKPVELNDLEQKAK